MSPDGIWAVRFGNAAQYAAFTEQYNDKLFENTFKVDNDEANRAKVNTFLTLPWDPLHMHVLRKGHIARRLRGHILPAGVW